MGFTSPSLEPKTHQNIQLRMCAKIVEVLPRCTSARRGSLLASVLRRAAGYEPRRGSRPGVDSMLCRTDSDCSLNGLCKAGACACDAPWAGNRCQTLQLAGGLLGLHGIPLCAYHGDGPNSTSWGALHARCIYTGACTLRATCMHSACFCMLLHACVQAARCCMRRRTASTICGQPR